MTLLGFKSVMGSTKSALAPSPTASQCPGWASPFPSISVPPRMWLKARYRAHARSNVHQRWRTTECQPLRREACWLACYCIVGTLLRSDEWIHLRISTHCKETQISFMNHKNPGTISQTLNNLFGCIKTAKLSYFKQAEEEKRARSVHAGSLNSAAEKAPRPWRLAGTPEPTELRAVRNWLQGAEISLKQDKME